MDNNGNDVQADDSTERRDDSTEPRNESATGAKATKKAKAVTDYSIKAIFLRAELAIQGTKQNPEIATVMAESHNYTSADLAAAETQYNTTQTLAQTTLQARAHYAQLTDDIKAARKVGESACADLALVCREELKDIPAALIALGLNHGPAPQALDAFLRYADTLFAGAQTAPDDVKARLAARGYSAAKLGQEQAKITALHRLNVAQEAARGKALDLTPQLQQALSELDDWVMTYRKYARRALKNRPQLLESIGVKTAA